MSPRQVTQLIADGEAALAVTAEHRRALAKKGQALGPGGDFPVHDLHHLRFAETQYKQGHLAGHPASMVKAHLRKAAARLGVESKLDDDDDEDESPKRTARRPARTGQRGQRAANTSGSESFHAGGWGDMAGGPDGGGGAAMTVALSADGWDELELAAPGTSRDSMLAEFFGDKAGEVAGMLARADASGDDDPSVDHEANVRRFRDLAGDSGFIRAAAAAGHGEQVHGVRRERHAPAAEPGGPAEG